MKKHPHCCNPPDDHSFKHKWMMVTFYLMIFKYKIEKFFSKIFK